MPNRILKESIKTSPEIDQLSWFEEAVFYRLMVTVDDYGCYDGRVIVIKNELFPTKENVTTKAVGEAIEKLERVKLLERYEVEGRPYLHLLTWEGHQRIRNKHRKYPDPVLDDNSLSNDGQTSATCLPESESESESESNKKNNKKKKLRTPTLEEIESYCRQRNNNVDAKKFFDYYSPDWVDGDGKPVKNWKQKIIGWETWGYNSRRQQDGGDQLPHYDTSKNIEMSEEEKEELLALMRQSGKVQGENVF